MPGSAHLPIAVWYHCKISGSGIPDAAFAASILEEQANALNESGLAAAADEIHAGVNGPQTDAQLVALLFPSKTKIYPHGEGARSELPTLARLRAWLPTHKNWLVCYHHSKGVTMVEHGVKSVAYKTHHRHTMEKYVIRNWRHCVADLEAGYEAVGCNLVDPDRRPVLPGRFFGGNFWWARADYLLKLPTLPNNAINYSDAERCRAETWIGSCQHKPRMMDYERPHLYQ